MSDQLFFCCRDRQDEFLYQCLWTAWNIAWTHSWKATFFWNVWPDLVCNLYFLFPFVCVMPAYGEIFVTCPIRSKLVDGNTPNTHFLLCDILKYVGNSQQFNGSNYKQYLLGCQRTTWTQYLNIKFYTEYQVSSVTNKNSAWIMFSLLAGLFPAPYTYTENIPGNVCFYLMRC